MNQLSSQKTILITGVSSGFGKASAEYLSQAGHIVYGTTRKLKHPDTPYTQIEADITCHDSIKDAISTIIKKEGHLDVLINNAGMGIAGPIEETSITEAKEQFEINLFALMAVTQQVLPVMRQQNSGLIINISSIAGLIATPFQGVYSASKFAVEGLTESLRMECKSWGINVVLVEPGDFKTGFTKNRKIVARAKKQSQYEPQFSKALRTMEKDERNGYPSERLAKLIARIITTESPKLRYSTGPYLERLAIILKKILPSSWFEWIIMKSYQLN